MALPLKKTLGEIRSDIQSRLGFGMAGQAGVVNSGLMDSMIRSAQEQLYDQFDWLELKGVEERATGTDQRYYDYPVDCNVDRIQTISVLYAGQYIPLLEGIELSDRGIHSVGIVPAKYERRDQIELWPVPKSADLTLRIEYIKTLGALVQNSDRVSLSPQAIYLHALSNAKAHYRQPDADKYAGQLEVLLAKQKARHRSKAVWSSSKPRSPYDYPPDSSQVV